MHLSKDILKGKKFKPGELKKEAREELKEAKSKALHNCKKK
jgi:hypothetical protein